MADKNTVAKLYALQTSAGVQTFDSPEEADKWAAKGMNRFLLIPGATVQEIGVVEVEPIVKKIWVGVNWEDHTIKTFFEGGKARAWAKRNREAKELEEIEVTI